MVRVSVSRRRLWLSFFLNEVEGARVCGVDDVVAKRGIEGSAPHPGSAPMIGKLESSPGGRRRVGALVGCSAALEKLRIPLAAGSLVVRRDVGEGIFCEAEPNQGWRLERKGLGWRIPLSRRVSFG